MEDGSNRQNRGPTIPSGERRRQEIIRLYSDEELTMHQIAGRLGLGNTTVMNALHKAQEDGDVVIRRPSQRTAKY